jgi:hypothetical protein
MKALGAAIALTLRRPGSALLLMAVPETDTRAPTVLVDELNAGHFQRPTDLADLAADVTGAIQDAADDMAGRVA